MSWFVHRPGLAIWFLVCLLLVTCLLTWLDPIIRAGQVPALIAISGWVSMAALPTLLGLFGDAGPAVATVWAVFGLYALSIVGTLGRPLLIFSDLLEEAESEGERLSASDWRRSRIGQVILICGIAAGVAIVAV